MKVFDPDVPRGGNVCGECVLHYGNGGLCVSYCCIRSQSLKVCAHVADRIDLNSVPSHLGVGYLTESVRPGWS